MVSSIKANTNKKVNQYNDIDSLVKGNFPRHENFRELAVFRFNRFLGHLLIVSIIASMISYSMVVAKENSLSSIHNKTSDLNFENIELQNKVDYVKSFNNINNKVASVNFLKKPDAVMEVNGSLVNPVTVKNVNKIETIKPISGY